MWSEKASSQHHCYSSRLDIDGQKGAGSLPVYTLLDGYCEAIAEIRYCSSSMVITPLSFLVYWRVIYIASTQLRIWRVRTSSGWREEYHVNSPRRT